MVQVKKYMEKAFWLLLIASPLLDTLNGIWAYVLSDGKGQMLSTLHMAELPGMSPSFTIRMVFLVLMTAYVFLMKKWRSVLMFVSIGFTWVLTVACELLRHVEFSLMADIQYIVRFCYCLLVMIVYSTMLKEDGRSREELRAAVDKVLTYSLLTLSMGVLVPYLFGMGFYTYADRMGYRGNRGFYYAGNDITTVMMLLLPIVLVAWLQQKDYKKPGLGWVQAAAAACCFNSMMIVGTKTSFLAAGATAAVLAGYVLLTVLKTRDWHLLIKAGTVALLVLALMLGLSALSPAAQDLKEHVIALIPEPKPEPEPDPGTTDPVTPDPPVTPDKPVYNPPPAQTGSILDGIKDSLGASDQLNQNEGLGSALLSGRTVKLQNVMAQLKEAMPFSLLVGIGRGSQERIIEMDLFEVFFYYGVLGCVTMLWLYLLQGVKVVIDLFRNFSLLNLAVCTALALCVGFLTLAGHTLFSVTGGFYFAFMIVYARLFCSKEGMETEIL